MAKQAAVFTREQFEKIINLPVIDEYGEYKLGLLRDQVGGVYSFHGRLRAGHRGDLLYEREKRAQRPSLCGGDQD